jgi:hypothetical protein
MKSSAHTEVSGVTVFDPIIPKEPDSSPSEGVVPPEEFTVQPERAVVAASIAIAEVTNHCFFIVIRNILSFNSVIRNDVQI